MWRLVCFFLVLSQGIGASDSAYYWGERNGSSSPEYSSPEHSNLSSDEEEEECLNFVGPDAQPEFRLALEKLSASVSSVDHALKLEALVGQVKSVQQALAEIIALHKGDDGVQARLLEMVNGLDSVKDSLDGDQGIQTRLTSMQIELESLKNLLSLKSKMQKDHEQRIDFLERGFCTIMAFLTVCTTIYFFIPLM